MFQLLYEYVRLIFFRASVNDGHKAVKEVHVNPCWNVGWVAFIMSLEAVETAEFLEIFFSVKTKVFENANEHLKMIPYLT